MLMPDIMKYEQVTITATRVLRRPCVDGSVLDT